MRIFKLFTLLIISLLFVSCESSSISSNEKTTEASYQVVVTGLWKVTDFATNFPSNAHFSPIVGMTHDSSTSLFSEDSIASSGLIQVAETGKTTIITTEINDKITNSKAEFLLNGSGISPGTGKSTFTFTVNSSNAHLSLVSMLAPSPDWFIGIDSLNLLDNGEWLSSKTINLEVYDSGSDSGVSFSSANITTNLKVVISKLTSSSSDTDFLDGIHRTSNKYIAKLQITKIN